MEAQQSGGMPAFLQESGNQFKNFVKNNNMFIIIVLIAIFLGIAFLIFTYFVQPSLSSTYIANNEFTQKSGGSLNLRRKPGETNTINPGGGDPGGGDPGGDSTGHGDGDSTGPNPSASGPGPGPGPASSFSLRAELYLFYADWCPYSKKLRGDDSTNGPWKKLKEEYPDGKKPEGSDYILKYVEINGDTDAKSIEHFEKMYLSGAKGIKKKIDGYPSIYLKIEDQIIEYEAEPSYTSLVDFIKQVVVNKSG
tara:strand:+ start:2851 stop:3603 length:753 start_codon:yes stop_codon:yes gene_type:complete